MELDKALTLLIGLCVLVLGYAQWRTANQRVVLDLFDRRTNTFYKITGVIGAVMRHGVVTPRDLNEFDAAAFDAKYLFGKDVETYLGRLRLQLAWMNSYPDEQIDKSPNSQPLWDRRDAAFEYITRYYEETDRIFLPYLRMTQRNTPFWRPW